VVGEIKANLVHHVGAFKAYRRVQVWEKCALLGYYAASSGNFLQTFWDNLSVPFLTLYDGTDKLCRNVCKKLSLLQGSIIRILAPEDEAYMLCRNVGKKLPLLQRPIIRFLAP